MKRRWRGIAGLMAALAILVAPGLSGAASIEQWASTVIGYSSQYSYGWHGWSAGNALGTPDTFGYGDYESAWAPLYDNGTLEYITLGYVTPVYATGVLIRETWGNGFVYQVDVVDTSDVYHTIWTGTDTSLPGTPVDFTLTWAATSYLVKGIKVYVDTNHNLGTWEEIDAMKLYGDTTSAVPLPPSLLLLAPGLLGLAGLKRRLGKKA